MSDKTFVETLPPRSNTPVFTRNIAIACAVLLAVVALLLRLMGREFASDSGLGFWTGAWTENTSQWIADPYSTSHILHGVFFYWMLWPLRHRLSVGVRSVVSMAVESSWELLENSPIIIERYRANTASLDYFGDSIMNSCCDILCALAGYWLAWRFGWKWMITLIVTVELAMLFFVRDNLTLNILMLIYPSEAIKQWQTGG